MTRHASAPMYRWDGSAMTTTAGGWAGLVRVLSRVDCGLERGQADRPAHKLLALLCMPI